MNCNSYVGLAPLEGTRLKTTAGPEDRVEWGSGFGLPWREGKEVQCTRGNPEMAGVCYLNPLLEFKASPHTHAWVGDQLIANCRSDIAPGLPVWVSCDTIVSVSDITGIYLIGAGKWDDVMKIPVTWKVFHFMLELALNFMQLNSYFLSDNWNKNNLMTLLSHAG